MNRLITLALAVATLAGTAAAELAFKYDDSKTLSYLTEPAPAVTTAPAAELRKELSAVVDEILDAHGSRSTATTRPPRPAAPDRPSGPSCASARRCSRWRRRRPI